MKPDLSGTVDQIELEQAVLREELPAFDEEIAQLRGEQNAAAAALLELEAMYRSRFSSTMHSSPPDSVNQRP